MVYFHKTILTTKEDNFKNFETIEFVKAVTKRHFFIKDKIKIRYYDNFLV